MNDSREKISILRGIQQALTGFLQVGGITKLIDSGLSVDTDIYASGDVVGSVIALPASVREKNGSGIIKSVVVVDADGQTADLDIYFFDELLTAAADNAAWAPTYADLQKIVGVASITSYTTDNSIDHAVVKDINLPFNVKNDAEALYMLVVSRGTPTYTAAGNLTVKVGISLD